MPDAVAPRLDPHVQDSLPAQARPSSSPAEARPGPHPGPLEPRAVDPRAAEIIAILAKETGIPAEQLRPEASIEALGIASLDMVQAIFEIEARWNVEVPVVAERSGAEFTTIGDLLAHVLHALDGPAATHQPGS